MRLAVNARFLTQPVTGVQRYARELVAALAAAGRGRLEPVLVAPRGELHGVPADLEVFRDRSRLRGHLWEQLRLPGLVRRLGAEALWSPCNSGPLRASRHIVTIHDAAVFAGRRWFSPWFGAWYRRLLRGLGRSSALVLTPSEFSRAELIRWGVAEAGRVRVVPGGAAERFAAARPDGPPGAGSGAGYVLTLGSRDPRKNLRRLIAAWDRLPPESRRGHRLAVAGAGSAVFRPERLHAGSPAVEFLGYVPDERLPGLYAGATAFACTSLYEGFGLPPLEAMACGTPVLASRIPALTGLCADAAAFCDPESVPSIADGLARLLADAGLRARLAEAGRRRARAFTWESAALRMLEAIGDRVPDR